MDENVVKELEHCKNTKKYNYEEFIAENFDLFSIENCNTDRSVWYYSCFLYTSKAKLLMFTVHGDTSFSNLANLLHPNKSEMLFFNLKSFVICDTKDEKLRNNICKLFYNNKFSFIDDKKLLKDMIGNEKLNFLFFTDKNFYKIEIKRIINVYKDIKNYFKYKPLQIKDNKCNLCNKNVWRIELERDPIVTEGFNKFCVKCVSIVRRTNTFYNM